MSLVLPAKLSRAVVTNHISSFIGIFTFLDEGLGLVLGNLQANSVEQSGTRIEALLYRVSSLFVAQDIGTGVLPMLYGMTAEEAKGGAFYGPHWFNIRGYPDEKTANKEAYDEEELKRFWEVSEELTGVTYDFLQPEPAYSV